MTYTNTRAIPAEVLIDLERAHIKFAAVINSNS